ncbi:hypothetical protein C3747_287g7 [Trypanosoma cruzi]|uniref:Reverse transcriptase domain-containing protein n=1 Tax=Trypanosoma cruzi TaxID=5693 RepID=A0A2V2VBH4_TRYCR|nr:hypothetical protein C3747_287g7 [Trypanosoma cruzi]RNC31940.1 Tbingi protein [Trypanosoma cruzi]
MHRNAPKHRTATDLVGHANAFDTVDHENIILKIRRLSIPNHIVRWSAEFLSGTSAVVRIDKLASFPNTSVRGAPQGTVLGPIICSIAMNSLCSCLSNAPSICHGLIADNPTHITQHSNRDTINSAPQKGLSAVVERTKRYFIKANAGKTGCTLLGTSNTAPLRLAYEDAPVTMERSSTLLGVNFQNPSGMGKHVARHREESKQRLLQLTAI